ncbi:ribonuclease P protein component [Candidatus Acetothermia bacterium]|nr:ribonuclease P protein component [Candidatus Acetothermia bacterium]
MQRGLLQTGSHLDIISHMELGPDEKFPVACRLKRRNNFKRVYDEGIFVRGRAFNFHLLARAQESLPRIGISFSEKWGGAIIRNRMKRLIRAVFRRNKEIFAGYDIIVHPTQRYKKFSAVAIEQVLQGDFLLATTVIARQRDDHISI